MFLRTTDSLVHVFARNRPLASFTVGSNLTELHFGILTVVGADSGVDGCAFHLVCLPFLRRTTTHLRPLGELLFGMLLGSGQSTEACPSLALSGRRLPGSGLPAQFPEGCSVGIFLHADILHSAKYDCQALSWGIYTCRS